MNAGLQQPPDHAPAESALDPVKLLAELQHGQSELAHALSHDLKAPLRAIQGFAQLLAQSLATEHDPRADHYLQRMQAGISEMETVIGALERLARVGDRPLELRSVALDSLARETLAWLRERWPNHQVDLRLDLTASLPPVDANLWRQLLRELFDNAVRFAGPDRDQVSIGLSSSLTAQG